jgi:hypothetical protein
MALRKNLHCTLTPSMTIDSNLKSKIIYILNSIRREEIIGIIKKTFAERNGINLPIFGVPRSNLNEFTTTEKDVKRGTNRFPPAQFRLKDEDVLRETSDTQMVKAEVMD